MSSRRPPARPPQIPGFTYERVLGSGGFADVFLYAQEMPRRQVAVKVLLAHATTPAAREQFVAEANVMAQLSTHPSIVTIYHADTAADGRPYLLMEYCSRPNLAVRYRSERITVVEAIRIGVRLAGAVETAHRAGILHRDIKPANVLTTEYGWPALTDFGISVAADAPDDPEATGMSIPWAAPEFFDEHAERGVRGDIYSLAATIHTLLAGRSPFEGPAGANSALDMITRIERDPVPSTGREDVPASLHQVLAAGMAKRPRDRYASAAEFARALQSIEAELHLAPTPLDVPDTSAIVPSTPSKGGVDDMRTRARSLLPVAAVLPASPAAAAPTAAAAPAAAAASAPSATAPEAAPADAREEHDPHPPAEHAPATSAPQRRRRWPAWAASAVVLLGVSAVVIYGAMNAPNASEPTAQPTTIEAPESTPARQLPPAPAQVSGVRDAENQSQVTFTWAEPAFDGELEYAYQVTTDEGAQGGEVRTQHTSVVVPDQSGRVCLAVRTISVESNRLSESTTQGCVQ